MSDNGASSSASAGHPLRVAVIGAGPAGIYAAEALTRQLLHLQRPEPVAREIAAFLGRHAMTEPASVAAQS